MYFWSLSSSCNSINWILPLLFLTSLSRNHGWTLPISIYHQPIFSTNFAILQARPYPGTTSSEKTNLLSMECSRYRERQGQRVEYRSHKRDWKSQRKSSSKSWKDWAVFWQILRCMYCWRYSCLCELVRSLFPMLISLGNDTHICHTSWSRKMSKTGQFGSLQRKSWWLEQDLESWRLQRYLYWLESNIHWLQCTGWVPKPVQTYSDMNRRWKVWFLRILQASLWWHGWRRECSQIQDSTVSCCFSICRIYCWYWSLSFWSCQGQNANNHSTDNHWYNAWTQLNHRSRRHWRVRHLNEIESWLTWTVSTKVWILFGVDKFHTQWWNSHPSRTSSWQSMTIFQVKRVITEKVLKLLLHLLVVILLVFSVLLSLIQQMSWSVNSTLIEKLVKVPAPLSAESTATLDLVVCGMVFQSELWVNLPSGRSMLTFPDHDRYSYWSSMDDLRFIQDLHGFANNRWWKWEETSLEFFDMSLTSFSFSPQLLISTLNLW